MYPGSVMALREQYWRGRSAEPLRRYRSYADIKMRPSGEIYGPAGGLIPPQGFFPAAIEPLANAGAFFAEDDLLGYTFCAC